MMNNSSKILFISTLIFGTILTISANSWLSAWMGLEINLLSFIPLMSDNNLISNEAALKYFLTQTIASTILLFAILLSINESFSLSMMFVSLSIKTGIAPMHFWFPNVMEGLSWMNSFIMMVWQKLGPMMLISYMMVTKLILLCCILSMMFGAIGGLNQTLLRKLMAYSSINHLSWMLSSMLMSKTLWLIYFMFYSFLSFNLIFLFNLTKSFHFNQLMSMFFNNKNMKFMVMLNFMSMGGLPPFLGFLPKWIIINSLIFNHYYMMTFWLIMFTLITLFFYMRMCYTNLMMNYYESYWMKNILFNKFHMKIFMLNSMISILGLFLLFLYFNV